MVKKEFLVAALVLFATQAPADERQVKRVPYNPQDVLVLNQGPLQGHVVITTALKSADSGLVVGECQTLVYGYGTYDKVMGFSCYKK